MTDSASKLPQIQVEHVSLAPVLFRSIKPKRGKLPELSGDLLLDNVSFQVFRGDRIAIVGASGAGKTTLLRVLNRLNEPTSGVIYLNGQPYASIPVVQLRRQIVLVLQESKLLGMTVQEAIAYPLRLRGIGQQEIQQRVALWMERLHLPLEWSDRTEQQLSVGQRQLVAIARALVTNPTVLLLDEPTSALDVNRIGQLFEILNDLNQHQQTTILMVNHQLALAQQFATRMLFLQDGKVISDQQAEAIDWHQLEQHLKQAEQAHSEEWD